MSPAGETNAPGLGGLFIFIGDTVQVSKRVSERKERGRDQGTVILETRVVNQRSELVVKYFDKVLVKRRPGSPAAV